jgi:predicted metal-dependent phosphoesterase TrpH
LIDLHTHTNESDGTYTPAELIQAAVDLRLEALGITDHDTFAGYDIAEPLARAAGLDLVCGIELSAKFQLRQGVKSVHILAYFLAAPPPAEFRGWLAELQAGRRERNDRLIARLQGMGVDITLAEVVALGRSLAGRPHFAKILVRKGYAQSTDQAFRDFIGEDAPGFVERDAPFVAATIARIAGAGGLAVGAHPIRLGIRDHAEEEAAIAEMHDSGLHGIEVYHSDQTPADSARYLGYAEKYGMAISGGSDFHGGAKPHVSLGSGIRGNVNVSKQILDNLRRRALGD